MKNYIKHISKLLAAIALLATSCDEGDTVVDQVVEETERGAILRTLSIDENEVIFDLDNSELISGGFSASLEVQDLENGGLLSEIEVYDKPTILVFNKIDAYSYIQKEEDDLSPETRGNLSLEDLKQSWIVKDNTPNIFISAKKKTNLDELRKLMYDEVRKLHIKRYPYNDFLFPDIEEEDVNL